MRVAWAPSLRARAASSAWLSVWSFAQPSWRVDFAGVSEETSERRTPAQRKCRVMDEAPA